MLDEKKQYKIADIYTENGSRIVVKIFVVSENDFTIEVRPYTPTGEKQTRTKIKADSYTELRQAITQQINKGKFSRLYLSEDNNYTETPIVIWA